MGWCFRNSSSTIYDGFKATFLYNSTMINDPTSAAFTNTFLLNDLYSAKLNIAEQEPIALKIDTNVTDWEIVPYKSKKVCI